MSATLSQPRSLPEAIRIRNEAACMSNGKLADEIKRALAKLQNASCPSAIGRAERRLHILQVEADYRMGGAR